MNAGVFDASASSGAPEMLELEVSAQDGLELVGTSALETSTVNLAAAKRSSEPAAASCPQTTSPPLKSWLKY